MLDILNGLREMTFLSILLRMVLSFICGGFIGIERECKRRAAGFRTHILICIGACVTTITGQYLAVYMHYFTDVSRLGAQVISGIGFIGAGAIIQTQDRKIRGLTTSAGLWAAAIVGLCFGAGYFEAGICATVLILIAEMVFARIEYYIRKYNPTMTLYVEYNGVGSIQRVLGELRFINIRVENVEISASGRSGDENYESNVALLSIRMQHYHNTKIISESIKKLPGVIEVDMF